MVAVTKIELYCADLEDAERYYSPHGNSPFTKVLDELIHHVGSDNLRWDARPVCTWLEDFTFEGETLSTRLSVPERDGYVEQFTKALGWICG